MTDTERGKIDHVAGVVSPMERAKIMALTAGAEKAFKFIAQGMKWLVDAQTYDDFVELSLLLLSFGTEQLLKLILCCHQYSQTGTYSRQKDIKHHRIKLLHSDVVTQCFSKEYLKRRDVRTGYEFLKSDASLDAMLGIMEWYAGGVPKIQGRYSDLDEVTTDEIVRDPVNHGLGELERKIALANQLGFGQDARRKIHLQIVETMTRYYRVQAHLIRFGKIGVIEWTSKHTTAIIMNDPAIWYAEMIRPVRVSQC